MTRRERAVRNCADYNAFSLSTTARQGDLKIEFKRSLERMTKEAGFDFFLIASFPRGDATSFVENRIASNWPQTLVNLYEEADMFYCSELVNALKHTIIPVYCNAGTFGGAAA